MSTSWAQRAFTSGEVSPSLYARADIVKYSQGLRTCKNFIVMRQGGVTNRPGMRFIAETGLQGTKSRLVEFIFSDNQAYALEFGHLFIRVYQNGGRLSDANGPLEVVSPYTESELSRLQYNQVGDVLVLTHKNHPIQELKRVPDGSGVTFTLSEMSTEPKQAAPVISDLDSLQPPIDGSVTTNYAVTAINDDTGEESLISNILTGVGDDPSPNFVWRFEIALEPGARTYNIYRRFTIQEEAWKLIRIMTFSDSPPPTRLVIDDGYEGIDQRPPLALNPFDEPGKYPAAVGHYQQRRFFGSTDNEPQRVWGSRLGIFNNFNRSSPIQDDDEVTFTMAGRTFNEVRHIVDAGSLILMTSNAIWQASGGANGVITPTQINLRQQGNTGSSYVRPVQVGNGVIFVQARGSKVIDLRYTFNSDGYEGQDLSVFSDHLFAGREVVDWAYQENPYSVIWCVMNDGELIGLTYMPEQEVWGWHRHETKGKVESITVVPEGQNDSVYLVVARTINGSVVRFIERMSDCGDYYMDCGLTYDGRAKGIDDDVMLSIIGSLSRDAVDMNQYQMPQNYFDQVGDIGNVIVFRQFDDPDIEQDTFRVEIVDVLDSTTVLCRNLRDMPDWVVASLTGGVTTSRWGLARSSFAGMQHLEGERIAVLADDNVVTMGSDVAGIEDTPIVVTNGAFDIPTPALVVQAGLPYSAEMETLDLESLEATLLDRQKIITKVSVMVQDSRSLFVANSRNEYREVKTRTADDGYGPKQRRGGIIEATIDSSWCKNGRANIRQYYPLPLTVLAVIPQGRIGGSRK